MGSMSRNLVEIVRRHHEVAAPTALEVLEVTEQAGRTPAIASAS